jgi:hypothetical protein
MRLPDFIGLGPRPHRHHLAASDARGPRRFATGRQEDAIFTTFYSKGIDWYAHHFRYVNGKRRVVEICPQFTGTGAPKRIRRRLPDCRLLVTFRNEILRPLTANQRAMLTERYLPEVEALEKLLKIDLSEWKTSETSMASAAGGG